MSRKRLAPAKWVLPSVIDPPDRICFQIEVPNERQHIAAFLGAIYDLAKPYKWANDSAHTAIQVGKVWFEIFENLRRGCEVPTLRGGADGDDFMIRQNPDNPCLLENSVDGVTWCTWADLSLCLLNSPTQPTGGGTLNPGECRTYDAHLDGNGQWLLPVPVSAGYTIEVSSLSGGWTDGSGSWYCPNGQGYTLGLCSGVGGFNGGDPLPTALHASVIFEANGTFYPSNIVAAIPSGVTDAQVTFQMNDASLSDNFGTVQFRVKVCAQAEVPLTIQYFSGSGPAAIQLGNTYVFNSQNTGSDQHLDFQPSHCVRFTIVGSSGFVPVVGGGAPFYQYYDCAAAFHNGPAATTASLPQDWPPATDVLRLGMGGDVSSPWTCAIRFDALAP